jgi:NADH:ubiquinone oxidoreductase subunit 6 (subunit J)
MKILIYFISVIALSIIVFNLTEINFKDFLSNENLNSGVMILAGFSCLIIMRIMLINEKIKKIKKK